MHGFKTSLEAIRQTIVAVFTTTLEFDKVTIINNNIETCCAGSEDLDVTWAAVWLAIRGFKDVDSR